MDPATVFVASSTEGLPTAQALVAALQARLGSDAIVQPWTEKFALSGTYIESLEKAADGADFAAFAVTADDLVRSRGKARAAPRDNVVFELGLFMGRIGRERCFIVVQHGAGVKVPSDLLGVHVAEFEGTPAPETLRTPASQIVNQMHRLSARDKPSEEARATAHAERSFGRRLEGGWWEYMWVKDGTVLSFFEITRDPVRQVLRLDGQAYRGAGTHGGVWSSAMVRTDPLRGLLEYLWVGEHCMDADTRHGYGQMSFSETAAAGAPFERGKGHYWDVDETQPANTCKRALQLRRVATAHELKTMRSGTLAARGEIARQIHDGW